MLKFVNAYSSGAGKTTRSVGDSDSRQNRGPENSTNGREETPTRKSEESKLKHAQHEKSEELYYNGNAAITVRKGMENGGSRVKKSASDNQISQIQNSDDPWEPVWQRGSTALGVPTQYGGYDKDYVRDNGGFKDEEDRHLTRGFRNECYLASEVCESMSNRQGDRCHLQQSPSSATTPKLVNGEADQCLYTDYEFLTRYALARERSRRNINTANNCGPENGYMSSPGKGRNTGQCGAESGSGPGRRMDSTIHSCPDNGYLSTSDSSDDVVHHAIRPIRRSNSGPGIGSVGTTYRGIPRSKSGHLDLRSTHNDIALRTGKRPTHLGLFDQDFRNTSEDQGKNSVRNKGPMEGDISRRRAPDKGPRNGIRPVSISGSTVQWESKLQELVELLTRTSLETHKLDLMAEISSLKIKLASADKDRRDLDERLRISQRQIKELESRLAVRDADITELRQRLVRNGTVVTPDASEYEVEKLKKAVDALMFSNQEKDKRIDELRKLLRRYKKIEEMVVQAQGRKALDEMMINAEDDTSSTSSTTPSIGDNVQKDAQYDESKADRGFPSATSTPVHSLPENGFNTGTSTVLSSTPKRTQGIHRSSSAEDINKKKAVNNNNHREGSYRDSGTSSFAHTEIVTDDEDGLQHATARPPDIKKKKGIRGFFGKLKRSGSQDFHEREREQFRRGGVRATASARLGWSRDARINDDTPFGRWDGERVTQWMNDIGLNMYLLECRRWVKNGEQLLRATAHETEKELGIKNPLHRKKLQLALQAVSSTGKVTKQDVDHNWVTRWLDDIGLPQYKDHFYDARVDGRMLQYLTVEDLLALKVTNELHHISIKRGIQVLHVHGFNPQCLRRRPSPEEGHLQNIPADVALWTNHRVMEWLRTIDLSEYAPNLRGSGVHGALMVLESRFNSELFAQLLSIPQNKTLLRRHLSTHFVALVGNETQHKKREQESMPGYVPLVPNSKIKSKKFGLFGHKRNKSDADVDDFICPDFTRRGLMNGRPHDKDKDEKAAKEIGAFSKEINTLTDMLAKDKFFDSVPTSNV